MRYVALLDCNNFFVSCERLFRPDLRKRPVIVLSSNDGCVVARSQEVKDIGVPMGVPYFQIKDIVKDSAITCFSSNFTLYRDISRRVFSVVREMCKDFEQYSIDEGFFYLEGEGALRRAQEIKDRVERLVGMPVSIGIAGSKTLAKFAAKRAKKQGGVYLLIDSDWAGMQATVKLGELWGVGASRVRNFAEYKLTTVAELLSADRNRVAKLFGVEGVRLQRELAGEMVSKVTAIHAHKQSLMSSRSFETPTHNLAVVQDALAYHTRRVAEDLRSEGLIARKITISMRSSRHAQDGYGGAHHELVLVAPTANVFELLRLVGEVVAKQFDPTVAYKKAGITASDIMPEGYSSGVLFAATTGPDTQLQSVMEMINRTHGQDRVHVGSYSKLQTWKSKREALSPAYTTRWNELRTVRA